MRQQFPVRAAAGCFALTAFAVAIVSGLSAGRSTDDVLAGGLAALGAGLLVGLAGASAIAAAIEERLVQYTKEKPVGGNASPEGKASS